jgi:hypothetical protein
MWDLHQQGKYRFMWFHWKIKMCQCTEMNWDRNKDLTKSAEIG